MSKRKNKNKEAKRMEEQLNVVEEQPVENSEIVEEQPVENVEVTEEGVGDNQEENVEDSVDENLVIEDEVNESEDTCQVGYVIPEKLNVRKEPSKDSEVLFIINKDKEVILDGEYGDFVKVVVDGNVGYCVKSFINY